ncbi:hypothetical protein J6590_026992 [Homalodisca vitripennis]|nr:hypothetical protein J6590_026992 [Homalodisca vitripennis]
MDWSGSMSVGSSPSSASATTVVSQRGAFTSPNCKHGSPARFVQVDTSVPVPLNMNIVFAVGELSLAYFRINSVSDRAGARRDPKGGSPRRSPPKLFRAEGVSHINKQSGRTKTVGFDAGDLVPLGAVKKAEYNEDLAGDVAVTGAEMLRRGPEEAPTPTLLGGPWRVGDKSVFLRPLRIHPALRCADIRQMEPRCPQSEPPSQFMVILISECPSLCLPVLDKRLTMV